MTKKKRASKETQQSYRVLVNFLCPFCALSCMLSQHSNKIERAVFHETPACDGYIKLSPEAFLIVAEVKGYN